MNPFHFITHQAAQDLDASLAGKGIAATRITSVGYGEARPVVPNDTDRNRGRNRRIEFAIAQ